MEAEAVDARHHNIRDDQIDGIVDHGVQGGSGIDAAHGIIASIPQASADYIVESLVVLYHKDMYHGFLPMRDCIIKY
jgi:hypothetical protein